MAATPPQPRPFFGSATLSIGWVIALLVLIACFVLALVREADRTITLGLIAALALARLIP